MIHSLNLFPCTLSHFVHLSENVLMFWLVFSNSQCFHSCFSMHKMKMLIKTGGWKEGLRVGCRQKRAICAKTSPFIHYILENIPKPEKTVIAFQCCFFSFHHFSAAMKRPTTSQERWLISLCIQRGISASDALSSWPIAHTGDQQQIRVWKLFYSSFLIIKHS